jgi:hypothetical protein
MFKFIFKTIIIVVILTILIILLAVWKGGEPFRWMGGKIEIVGRAIERFGDKIDVIKKSKEKVGKELKEFKEGFDFIQQDKQPEHKDGAINKN